MGLILNIDTALDIASICLAKDGMPLYFASNEQQKDHAKWLHPAIAASLRNEEVAISNVDAIAITIGPGSYTGLRVGLATAKGLCYVLNIPLITIGTLEMIAFAVKDEATDLICPLIDARRMEVFTAVYDKKMTSITEPQALIINENSFIELLSSHHIVFCGNGRSKLQSVISNKNAGFSGTTGNASNLAELSWTCFSQKQFADLAYTEPLYLKEFYSTLRKL